MALIRFRRRRLCALLLVACLFCLVYLIFSLPAKGEWMTFPGQPAKLLPRKHFTVTEIHHTEPVNNVLAAPHILRSEDHVATHKQKNGTMEALVTVTTTNKHFPDINASAIGSPIQNGTKDIVSEKVRNKVPEVEEAVKNKTLKQVAVIDVVPSKRLPQLVFVPRRWNLTISFEDIGEIMKETQFLSKINLLNLDGPILLSSRNRTANFTYSMPLKFGFCDCFERYCVCCSRIINRRLHLNATACSNFTFVSKTHELDLRFSLDGRPVHKSLISADKSPLLCMGSVPKVADICVHFFNMTFKVNEHNTHQTQLLGCTDLSLSLYNKTIGAFPVDCFQIPGDPNQVHKERKFNMMPNWMP